MDKLVKMTTSIAIVLAIVAAATLAQPSSAIIGSQQRIIGGQLAMPRQFPYFVSMRIADLVVPHFCSGTILSDHWIISAAICVSERTNVTRISLVMGTVRMQDHGDRYAVKYVLRHPKFTGRSIDWLAHNVALIKTTTPIKMNERVQPIKLLANELDGDTNALAMTAGWQERHESDRLRFLVANLIGNVDCRGLLTTFQRSYVLNETVCTLNDPGQGLSFGDYGTGLVNVDDGRLMGVASVFMFDARGGKPDIFIRIDPYLDWIQQVMNGTRID